METLADIRRVLKPGGAVHLAFSNRCFPTKAVMIWRMLNPADHARLVSLYLEHAGYADIQVHRLLDGSASDPMTVVSGRRGEA